MDTFISVLRNDTMTCLIYVNSSKLIVSQLYANINAKYSYKFIACFDDFRLSLLTYIKLLLIIKILKSEYSED